MPTNPAPEDLPEAVRDLFEGNEGRWSATKAGVFDFTCPECNKVAVCRLEEGKEADRWLSHCPTEGCGWHGEQEIDVTIPDEDVLRQRKETAKQYPRDPKTMIGEIEAFLAVAAAVREPDSDNVALLDSMVDVIRRYVTIGRDEAIITALWIVHTWCLPAAKFTPYIHLRSALPREGKSRLLDVVKYMVARGVRMSDPTPAAIADAVKHNMLYGLEAPTFLWDEIDSAYDRWPALREYVNLGFEREGSTIIRAGGVSKPTFSPKLMAGLTELPQTVRDRSFRFDMLRATRDEKPERLTPTNRRALELEGDNIRFALNVFAERHTAFLADSEPDLPDALDDRAQDIAEPLLAIADLVGGVWPEQARAAMIKIRTAMFTTEADQDLLLLLRDIKEVFSIMPALYSRTLVKRLRNIEEHPWGSLTQHKLAGMLRSFSEYPGGPRITSRRMRIGGSKRTYAYAYERKQFKDAWERYL